VILDESLMIEITGSVVVNSLVANLKSKLLFGLGRIDKIGSNSVNGSPPSFTKALEWKTLKKAFI